MKFSCYQLAIRYMENKSSASAGDINGMEIRLLSRTAGQ